MTRPLISIFHMGHNQGDAIEKSIRALFAQTYSPLEIILSDDCSTDDTFGVMQRLAAEYTGPHRIILNRNPVNLGIVGNFNKVTDLTSGVLVVQANGDDMSLPHRVERLYKAWAEDPEHIKLIYSDMDYIDENDNFVRKGKSTNMETDTAKPRDYVVGHGYVTGASVAFTPDLLTRFGPIADRAIVEDHILPFRAALIGRLVHVDEILVNWRIGGMSWFDEARRSHPDNFYFGQHLTVQRRMMANQIALLGEYENFDFEGIDDCRAFSKNFVHRTKYMLMIAKMNYLFRLLSLPAAYFMIYYKSDKYYLMIHMRYLCKFMIYPKKMKHHQNKLSAAAKPVPGANVATPPGVA